MNAVYRRGACPGLSAPMPTGDGLLVRFMPTEPIPLNAFVGFCEAVHQHGNGTIEISARGSLQVRGLTPRSALLFESAVAELGLVAHEGVPVVPGFDLIGARLSCCRATATPSPLVGEGWGGGSGGCGNAVPPLATPTPDPSPQGGGKKLAAQPQYQSENTLVNTAEVAAELRRALANVRLTLSPKVSVVVDGNGPLHLDALPADVRLRATGTPQPRFCLGIGGDGDSGTWLGSIAPKDAASAVLGLLTLIAKRGATARADEILRAEGIEPFRSVSGGCIEPSPIPPRRRPAEMVGVHPIRDGPVAVGIGFAFGYADAVALTEVVRIAALHGARAARPAPGRTLLLFAVPARSAPDLTASAEQLGFVVHGDDPRRRIAACPGAPACAWGLIPARALASALTPALQNAMGSTRSGIAVHISGCPKGCAHPKPALLTLVGTPSGCGIVHDGSARTIPDRYVDAANLAAEISRIIAKIDEAAHG